MKQQRIALSRLKVLLLAIGLVGATQPSLASDHFEQPVPSSVALEELRAPSYLGGVSLERQRSWQPATAYELGPLSLGYGPASAEGTADPSTVQVDTKVDPVQTAAIIPGVFGTVAFPMRNFPASARWAPVYQAIVGCSAGSPCERKSAAFAAIIDVARGKSFSDKLSFVNSSINRLIAYKKDSAVYGKFDYWAKPSETLDRRAGDCEDFAILKMTALLRAGIPAQSMSLVVLQDRKRQFFHAVLSVSTGSGTFILDNLSNLILQDRDLPDYQPLYSVSTDRAWIHGVRSGAAQVADIKGGFTSIAPGEGLQ